MFGVLIMAELSSGEKPWIRPNMLGSQLPGYSLGAGRSAGRMGKSAFKAIGVLLALRRHSKQHANWTLSIAVLSTLVTVGLFALYLMRETPEFP
jgi:hypothetical protein